MAIKSDNRVNYPAQNAATNTNPLASKWRRSCLAGPQMAGIPTTFQDDEVCQLDNWNNNHDRVDLTGGAMTWARKQKRNSQ